MWNLKTKTAINKQKQIKLTDTENRLVVARGRKLGVEKMGEGSQKI